MTSRVVKVRFEPLAVDYIRAGLKLVPVPRGKKGPDSPGWNLPEKCIGDVASARRLSRDMNIGLAHAYCEPPTAALDLDSVRLARPWLQERGIELDPMLKARDAVRIISGREDRAKLLYRLTEPLVTLKPQGSGLELRCAASNGSTVQDILPPSIHPDTKAPYRLHGNIFAIPKIPPALLTLWRGYREPKAERTRSDHGRNRIPVGARNDTLMSIAGAMRRKGVSQAGIEAALLTENRERCEDPLPEKEVRNIARSASTYPSGDELLDTTAPMDIAATFRADSDTPDGVPTLHYWNGVYFEWR